MLTVSMQWSLDRGREKIFRTGFRVRAGGRECNADFPLGRRNPVLPTAGKELEGLEFVACDAGMHGVPDESRMYHF